VLAATAPSIQTPLASAAELADANRGAARQEVPLRHGSLCGPRPPVHLGIALVAIGNIAPRAKAPCSGSTPALASMPERAQLFFTHSTRPGVLNLTSFLSSPHPALGFDFSAPRPCARLRGSTPKTRFPQTGARHWRRTLPFQTSTTRCIWVALHRASDVPADQCEAPGRLTGGRPRTPFPFGAGVFTIAVSPNGSLGGRVLRAPSLDHRPCGSLRQPWPPR